MNRINLNLQAESLTQDLLEKNGLGEGYSAEIKSCTSIKQVFDALNSAGADHFALLSSDSKPIKDVFGHIKTLLAGGEEVPLALFFKKMERDATLS